MYHKGGCYVALSLMCPNDCQHEITNFAIKPCYGDIIMNCFVKMIDLDLRFVKYILRIV